MTFLTVGMCTQLGQGRYGNREMDCSVGVNWVGSAWAILNLLHRQQERRKRKDMFLLYCGFFFFFSLSWLGLSGCYHLSFFSGYHRSLARNKLNPRPKPK